MITVNRSMLGFLLACLLVLAAAPVATAVEPAAPANDDIANPTVIGSLPFTETIDTTNATIGATDPGYCAAPEWGQSLATVWYAYTATTSGPVGAMTYGSDYSTTLDVGVPDGKGGIDVLACNVDNGGTSQSAVRFEAEAGVTYLISVGADPFAEVDGGQLVFSLEVAGPGLAVDVEIDDEASLVNDGQAIVRGTFACSAPTSFSTVVFIEMAQTMGNRTIHGFGYADIAGCPSTGIPFEVLVGDESPFLSSDARANEPFVPGAAQIQAVAGACDRFGCASETVDLTLTLRR